MPLDACRSSICKSLRTLELGRHKEWRASRLASQFRDRMANCRDLTTRARQSRMPRVERQDVERIARVALKELGVSSAERAAVAADDQSGNWRIDYDGPNGRSQMRIKCGPGTTAQWVREQIFQQYLAQT